MGLGRPTALRLKLKPLPDPLGHPEARALTVPFRKASFLTSSSISLLPHFPRAWSRGLGPYPDTVAGGLYRLLSKPAVL